MAVRKLLFVFDNMDLTGSHRVALNLMDAAADAGLTCRGLVCMNDNIRLSERDHRFSWPNAALGRGGSLPLKALKAVCAVWQTWRLARQADIVIAVCPPSAVVASIACSVSRTPLIGWVHYDVEGRRREPVGSTTSRLRDWMQDRLYYSFVPRLPHLAFVSDAASRSMAKGRRRRSVPPGWQVLPNLFVAGCFEEASASLERFEGIKALGEPVLLFLGRLAHQKRWEDTIRAAEELQRLGVRAQWVFLGDGPQRSAFLNMLAASSARDRLHWLGSDPNPRPVLARASALVLTSLYEAWPTVILEAFDLGVPVVSYDCPSGPSEMLGNQERGWLTSENPKSLAAAVAELLSPGGTEEACRRTEAGRSFVDAHRPEKAMAAWLNYFDHVHAGRF